MNKATLGRIARRHALSARLLGEWRVRQLSKGDNYTDVRMLQALAMPSSCVIDVGANVGNYALAARRRVGRAGQVIAIEAHPFVFGELVKSTWGTGIEVMNVAASDRAGMATLTTPRSPSGGTDWQLATLESRPSIRERDTAEVPTIALDDLKMRHQVSVIKIDVEGHERHVLEGARRILQQHRPALVVEIEQRHLGSDTLANVVEVVLSAEYHAYALGASRLIPWSSFDVERHQTQWLHTDSTGSVEPIREHYVNNFLFLPV